MVQSQCHGFLIRLTYCRFGIESSVPSCRNMNWLLSNCLLKKKKQTKREEKGRKEKKRNQRVHWIYPTDNKLARQNYNRIHRRKRITFFRVWGICGRRRQVEWWEDCCWEPSRGDWVIRRRLPDQYRAGYWIVGKASPICSIRRTIRREDIPANCHPCAIQSNSPNCMTFHIGFYLQFVLSLFSSMQLLVIDLTFCMWDVVLFR